MPGQGQRSLSQDGVGAAVLHLVTCVRDDDAIVTIDSALNSGLLTVEELGTLRQLAPLGKRALFERVDGSSQSGLETKTRLRLRRRRVQVRTQVPVPGVGFVDEIVGERLVLESDGYRYHGSLEQFREDRRRDLELARQEYLCIRLDNHQIMEDWPRTEEALLSLIHRQEHLWTAPQRRRRGLWAPSAGRDSRNVSGDGGLSAVSRPTPVSADVLHRRRSPQADTGVPQGPPGPPGSGETSPQYAPD
ncbi:DUF559 domain-containing protein [Rathayibacter sp. SD072]|uniref:DUF559 domain-containing protein n=1 Tax=Rathayibacter sp. SD072 TaxID=2781731 RepID=UPI001A965EEF|nr:DUF559 domain-containing protein [Rathayibacter sp. SD072]MBO0984084.1 DUF559 domain-containing protein [Rathayibacter sp. SD072]